MKDTKLKLAQESLLSSIILFLYVAGISWVLYNGERFFDKIDDFTGPLLILLIFILSATITSSLIFGRPVYLFFTNLKKEGIKSLLYTILFLFIITLVVFIWKLVI